MARAKTTKISQNFEKTAMVSHELTEMIYISQKSSLWKKNERCLIKFFYV